MTDRQLDESKTCYRCGVCDNPPDMSFNEMMLHCEEEHNESVRGMKVEKEMVCHVDGEDYYTYLFRITSGSGFHFYQNQYFPRRKNDYRKHR